MGNRTRMSLLALVMAVSPAFSSATCWQSADGQAASARHPTVSAEFKSAEFVLTGRVQRALDIASPDDPQGYAWTVYDVDVMETFKGRLPRVIQLKSENSSARFPMDIGKSYLLFVSKAPSAERVAERLLPQEYIDNCGNSGLASERVSIIGTIKALAGRH